MNNNLTELVFILDRSGSMSGLESDTIGGFNAMIRKQLRKEGQALVSTLLFSDHTKVLHDRIPLDRVPLMTEEDYTVRGSTALLDAVGDAVKHISNIHKYAREEDRPARTLFVITTDGMENASRRWSYDKVKALVESRQELGWEFLFLGANMDAVAAAASLGIRRERAVRYRSDSEGTSLNFEGVSRAVEAVRCNLTVPESWKEDIEKDYRERRR